VKDIQNRLNVRIQIPHSSDVGSNPPVRTISITGPAEFQPVAKYEIEMIAAGTPVHSVSGGSSANAWAGTAQSPWPQASYGSYYSDPSYASAAYQQQQQYGYYGAQGAVATAAVTEPAVAQDPTAYYNDFWQYAMYYGEAAARLYYGAWSPAEGTPAPDGMVLPTSEQAAANIASANAGVAVAPVTETVAEVAPVSEGITESTPSGDDSAALQTEDADWEAYKKQVGA
jgi:far upstream element-binding protein